MSINSIANINLFKILDESTNITYFGCSQQWYPTKWQRLSGCGPTVATNIVFYLENNHSILDLEQRTNSKKNWLSLMEKIWTFVTPTPKGINTTKMFYEDVIVYTKSNGLSVEFEFCDLPEDKSLRPEFSEILIFLERALNSDSPIAFLNLCNGEEKNLDSWHWVTIISLEYQENRNRTFIEILDEGSIKKIDLALWYNTTTLGGGFVYFTASSI